jgi:hypothetical protein
MLCHVRQQDWPLLQGWELQVWQQAEADVLLPAPPLSAFMAGGTDQLSGWVAALLAASGDLDYVM